MKPLIIFGSADIAQLAYYYFTTDTSYEVTAFTVDAAYIKEAEFCGLPMVPFEDLLPATTRRKATICSSLSAIPG